MVRDFVRYFSQTTLSPCWNFREEMIDISPCAPFTEAETMIPSTYTCTFNSTPEKPWVRQQKARQWSQYCGKLPRTSQPKRRRLLWQCCTITSWNISHTPLKFSSPKHSPGKISILFLSGKYWETYVSLWINPSIVWAPFHLPSCGLLQLYLCVSNKQTN